MTKKDATKWWRKPGSIRELSAVIQATVEKYIWGEVQQRGMPEGGLSHPCVLKW